MKYAELLQDPESLARGQELIEIMQGLSEQRRQVFGGGPRSQEYFFDTVDELVEAELKELADSQPTMERYAKLGMRVVGAKLAAQHMYEDGQNELRDYGERIRPVMDFMRSNRHRHVVAERPESDKYVIARQYGVFGRMYPRQVEGFFNGAVSGYNTIYIQKNLDAHTASYSLTPVTYGGEQVMKIAIGR